MTKLIASFLEFTKGMSFLEKLVCLLVAMYFGTTLYEKVWGEPAKTKATQETHRLFWGKLDDMRDDQKEFHAQVLASHEKTNDRLLDLLGAQKKMTAAVKEIPDKLSTEKATE